VARELTLRAKAWQSVSLLVLGEATVEATGPGGWLSDGSRGAPPSLLRRRDLLLQLLGLLAGLVRELAGDIVLVDVWSSPHAGFGSERG